MRGGNPLVVSWARTKVMVDGPAGKRDVVDGTVGRDDRVQVELESVRREFMLGEGVTFTPAEFAEMMFGLVSFFLLPVMGAVVNAFKASGLVTPDGEVVKPHRGCSA